MARPYGSAIEHVDEELGRVAKIFERRIELDWARGVLPRLKDDYSGTFVSGGEVRALLAGGLPLDEDASRRVEELAAEIDDEADSLFAKRTEVKTSVDRYANLEVNYLLQRMERFEGVTILTTNLESSIDSAFKRRLAFRLDFPFPGEEERERLWRAMLPSEAVTDEEEFDFADLSRRYEMSGGNIRNAVLRAAFLAAGRGERIAMPHLDRAAELEYGAMGKVVASGGGS